MERITLTKGSAKIVVDTLKDKVVIHYEFIKDATDSLDDYIYLLDKIHAYMKSGEYVVENQALDTE